MVCGGALALSFFLSPENLSGPSVCLFKQTTGFDCVGCGLTRGFVALSHGHLLQALQLNPLVIVLYPGFLVGSVLAFFQLVWGYEAPWFSSRLPNWFYGALVGLVLLLWLWRFLNPLS